jgi:hypothetical protein
MQQYNKTTAAVISGAIVTIIIAIANAYSEQMRHALNEPGVQAALQTLITAAVVFFAPANKQS